MAEEPNNLVIELLRTIRGQLDRIESDIGDLKIRVSSVEGHVASLHVDMAAMNKRMDRFDDRLARIERRLDLADA